VLSAISTFVTSITGKVVLGTAVAAASVGTAHAAHVVDLPGAPRSEPEVVVEQEVTPDVASTTTEAEADSVAAMADGEQADASAEDPADDPDVESEDEQNHGQIVSEFAHTTELEGCERGQAIADLASDGRSNRQAPLDNCAKSDESEDDSEEEADETEEPTVTPTASEQAANASHGKALGHSKH
jgi:hypothetical protein